jgi:hypothetical protein
MRLRLGEVIALAGSICVIVALTRWWYEGPSGDLDAWDTFGPTIVLLLIAVTLGVLLAIATVGERSTALPVALAVWSTLFGLIGVICAVIRLLERPQGATNLCAGTWLAALGAVGILVGSWLSLRDERPSMYKPVAPKPQNLPEGDSRQA